MTFPRASSLAKVATDARTRRILALAFPAFVGTRLRLLAGHSVASEWATCPRSGEPVDPGEAWGVVTRMVRPGRLSGRCLVRSLVLSRLLTLGGGKTEIHFGVRNGGDKGVEAHSWVEFEGARFGWDEGFIPLERSDIK